MSVSTMSDIQSALYLHATVGEVPMRRLLVVMTLVAAVGCGDKSSPSAPSAPKPDDPNIRIKESIGGGVGPVGGGRSRDYEGPVSKAPDWAKPKASGGK